MVVASGAGDKLDSKRTARTWTHLAKLASRMRVAVEDAVDAVVVEAVAEEVGVAEVEGVVWVDSVLGSASERAREELVWASELIQRDARCTFFWFS